MGIAIIREDFQMKDTNLVTVSDAAEKTGYTGAFIRLIANQGRIKAKKFGYMWQIDLDDLLSYKEKMDQLGKEKHALRYDGDDEPANETG